MTSFPIFDNRLGYAYIFFRIYMHRLHRRFCVFVYTRIYTLCISVQSTYTTYTSQRTFHNTSKIHIILSFTFVSIYLIFTYLIISKIFIASPSNYLNCYCLFLVFVLIYFLLYLKTHCCVYLTIIIIS